MNSIEEITQEFEKISFCKCGCMQKTGIKPDPIKYYKYKKYGYIKGHYNSPKIGDYHLTPNQGIVWMKSQLEIKYALYLESIGIEYYYEPNPFAMNINGRDTTYTPDFLLLNDGDFIEIKVHWCDGDIDKLKSNKFKEDFCEYFRYEVLFEKDLIKLGINI